MTIRRLHYSTQTIRGLRAQIERHQKTVLQIRSECSHTWKVHSHYPKPFGDTGKISRWWVHLTCTVCDVTDTSLKKQPVCEKCLQPLTKCEADDHEAEAKRAEIMALQKYPSEVYLFRCVPCATLYGFPVRIDEKK